MSTVVYDVFDDVRNSAGNTAVVGDAQVSMPMVSEECLLQWWQRRFVDGVDTVSLMAEAQRWVDQLAIAAVALLEVDSDRLRALLPPHELGWLLELHQRLCSLQRPVSLTR